jgi:lysophospholipase L1-like esterase
MTGEKRPGTGIATGKKVLFAFVTMAGFLLLAELLMQLFGLALTVIRKPALRPGAKVIVCLGDSHTYGVMVDQDQTYPAQLERLLNQNGGNYQVVNLGVPGQNTAQVINSLPGIIKTYRPLAVLVLAGINNGWNISGRENSLCQKVMSRSKICRLLRLVYFHGLRRDRKYLVESRRDSGEIVYHLERGGRPYTDAENWTAARNMALDFASTVRICRDHGVKVMLLNYAGDKHADYDVPNQVMQAAAADLRAPLVDNYSLFMSRLYGPDGALDENLHPQLFFNDMHLRPLGYSWMAGNIYESMLRNSILE